MTLKKDNPAHDNPGAMIIEGAALHRTLAHEAGWEIFEIKDPNARGGREQCLLFDELLKATCGLGVSPASIHQKHKNWKRK